jgi:hypothetical protein
VKERNNNSKREGDLTRFEVSRPIQVVKGCSNGSKLLENMTIGVSFKSGGGKFPESLWVRLPAGRVVGRSF